MKLKDVKVSQSFKTEINSKVSYVKCNEFIWKQDKPVNCQSYNKTNKGFHYFDPETIVFI